MSILVPSRKPPLPVRRSVLALALACATLAAHPAAADTERPTTPEEARQIDQSLRREGFVRWGEVTFEHGRFEVDDAVHTDGQTYDVKLSGVDFTIMEKKRDD